MPSALGLSILTAAGGEAEAGAGAAPTQTMLIKIGKSCGKCVNSNYMGINAHIAYE